jgi:nucleotide-binding universal stress UspA family protein
MFRQILVGVDETQPGRDAIALARRLATPDTHITLVHVWNPVAGLLAAAGTEHHPAQEAERLLAHERLQAALDCSIVARAAGSPAAGLHDLATERGADLIVIGSPGKVPGQTALSDDIAKTLHGTPCALAVAPCGYAERRGSVGWIGVAFESTPAGHSALRVATVLAQETDAELHGMTVIPPLPPPSLPAPMATLRVLETVAGDSVGHARQTLARQGTVPHAVVGPPADELITFSEAVDLLVLGSRGRGPVRRLLIGSTATGVRAGAHCPVIVVPPDGLPVPEDAASSPAAVGAD